MAANLWSDEQKPHQAIVKDMVALQIKVQSLLVINCSKCGRYVERKKRVVPREVSPAGGNERTNSPCMKPVETTNGEKSAEVIVLRRLQTSWEGLSFRNASNEGN